jgi:2-oxoisovalerate dehydrogenase E1 component
VKARVRLVKGEGKALGRSERSLRRIDITVDNATGQTKGMKSAARQTAPSNTTLSPAEILRDYRIAIEGRQISLIGRKQVLNGKAKFGIFGDGKEIAQIALARAMQPGDFLVGYYRDQGVVFSHGTVSYKEFFSQLYADVDYEGDVVSVGRQMNGFSATRFLNKDGSWKDLTKLYNSSSDTSPTSSQMPRSLGMALASKLFRENSELHALTNFSKHGNEVVCATIGDASTAEGHFWETLNAAGVMRVPLAVSVWDDGYGISVPRSLQTTKGSISEICAGFQTNEAGQGIDIYVVNGWDYQALVETYARGIAKCRETQIPALFHIKEVTQPQGHSTSGSHERYKSPERLQWEKDFCCIAKTRTWILNEGIATEAELQRIEQEAESCAKEAQQAAWSTYRTPIENELEEATRLLEDLANNSAYDEAVTKIKHDLRSSITPIRRDIMRGLRRAVWATRGEDSSARINLIAWMDAYGERNRIRFNTDLHSETAESALKVEAIPARFSENSPIVNGNQIIQACMADILARDSRVCIFGEDVGIGDVNHGLVGLSERFGKHRIFDTGIREATIIGQGIGMAMRGLRPIAEIQYLDYLLFGFQPLSDDLATLRYRCIGGQKAPLIVRTRGHRLEGIWHTGSPMGMILHGLRGMYVLTPRNMVQAAGLYNTMLRSDDPALLIEPLNGYGVKERLPDNIGEFTVALGVPEVLRAGSDVTLVTYGSCCRIALDACDELQKLDISVELIDAQTLLPFDRNGYIVESLKKTNRIVFLDEDVPGGASAFMLREVLECQGGYFHLDSQPITITAKEHRGAYSSDGDYFSKPSAEDVVEAIYALMREADENKYLPLK